METPQGTVASPVTETATTEPFSPDTFVSRTYDGFEVSAWYKKVEGRLVLAGLSLYPRDEKVGLISRHLRDLQLRDLLEQAKGAN